MKAKFIHHVMLLKLILLALLPTTSVFSQQTKEQGERYYHWKELMHTNSVFIASHIGYGSYSMSGLKDLQKSIVSSSGFSAIQNSLFPNYGNYGFDIMLRFDNSKFGVNYEYLSTGARSSIADYSLEFTSDFICKGYKYGFVFEKDFDTPNTIQSSFHLGYRLESGGIYSNIVQTTNIVSHSQEIASTTTQSTIEALGLYIEPALYLNWHFEKKTYLQASAGIFTDFKKHFDFIEIDPRYPISWFGMRLKIGIVRQL